MVAEPDLHPHPPLGSALNWTCGSMPDGVTLECLDVATWHGFHLTDDGRRIKYMMAACDEHRTRMRAHFEHPMDSACAVPGSRFVWPENFCYLEWGDDDMALAGRAGLEAHLTPIRSGVTPSEARTGLSRRRTQELRAALAELDRARAQAWVESRSYLVRGRP